MARPFFFHATALILIAAFSVTRVQGFASWLKCFVDLTDPTEVIMNNLIIAAENAPHQCEVEVKLAADDEWSTTNLTYPADKITIITARLKVPAELSSHEVQYVMETSAGAKFTRPVMCDGKRSHATQYNEAVVLEVDGTTDAVELVAGWATGHEAVSLTRKTVLRKEGSTVAEEL
jgi:hypothetical protein